MRIFCLCLSLATLQISEAQFRGFSNPRSNPNHDLLKQIVDHTPEEEAENRLTRFGGQRSSILDRARSRPNTFTPLSQRSRPRFTPSVPRFGSGANNLNLVTSKKEDTCEDLRGENELLKQLVESLKRQQQASDAREKLLQVEINYCHSHTNRTTQMSPLEPGVQQCGLQCRGRRLQPPEPDQ